MKIIAFKSVGLFHPSIGMMLHFESMNLMTFSSFHLLVFSWLVFSFLWLVWISFRCNCPPGYFGALCSLDVNECEASPCLHDGVCINRPGGFRCICLPGFSGTYISLPRGDKESMAQTKRPLEYRPLRLLRRHDSISGHHSLHTSHAWVAFKSFSLKKKKINISYVLP